MCYPIRLHPYMRESRESGLSPETGSPGLSFPVSTDPSLECINGGRGTLVDSGNRCARPRALSPPTSLFHPFPPIPRKPQATQTHRTPFPSPPSPLDLRLPPAPFSAHTQDPRATPPFSNLPSFPFPMHCVLLPSLLSLHGSRFLPSGRRCAVSVE